MRNNPLAPYEIISAGDLSGNLTSAVTGISYQDNISIQCVVTGSPVGDFAVQGSNDYIPGPNHTTPALNAGNWVTLGTLSVTGADDLLFDVNQMPFPYIRLIYTSTSGTGAVTATIAAKKV